MCDPLSLGALAIGAAGTAANAIGQNNAQRKQKDAYMQWAQKRQQNQQAENVRQEGLRQEAEASRLKGVEDISGENQAKLQAAEEERLKAEMTGTGEVTPTYDPAAPTSVADPALTGQSGGGEIFQSELAKSIADATASAKQRIGALATINSYGGSRGGLGTVNPINQSRAGAGIDRANELRRGSLAAFQTEQNVSPLEIEYSNPIADIAQSFLGVGMQGIGKGVAGGGAGGSLGSFLGSKVVTPPVTGPVPQFAPLPPIRPAGF